jgi:hypothetical protein
VAAVVKPMSGSPKNERLGMDRPLGVMAYRGVADSALE